MCVRMCGKAGALESSKRSHISSCAAREHVPTFALATHLPSAFSYAYHKCHTSGGARLKFCTDLLLLGSANAVERSTLIGATAAARCFPYSL